MVDFGFCKQLQPGTKTYTMCGTPLYLAPEVILNRGHSFAVDHWSLGILTYEMLVGHPVFYRKGMNRSDLFRAIVAAKVEPPENITYEALDLIGALLKRDPAKRLGSRQGGESEIIAHPWFKGIDFHSLFLRTMKAPYIPKIKDTFDVSCFPSWDHVEDKRKKQYPELTDAQNDFFKSF